MLVRSHSAARILIPHDAVQNAHGVTEVLWCVFSYRKPPGPESRFQGSLAIWVRVKIKTGDRRLWSLVPFARVPVWLQPFVFRSAEGKSEPGGWDELGEAPGFWIDQKPSLYRQTTNPTHQFEGN